MSRHKRRPGTFALLIAAAVAMPLAACAPDHSPDVYSPGGLQQAEKVDRAVVKGCRQVDVRDPSLGLGTATGAAAGGLAAAAVGSGGGNGLAVLGGVLVGGAIGALAERKLNEAVAYEYILEKPNGDLMTIAQKQDKPYPIGSHVLIIYGVQARLIPDDTGAAPPAHS